MSKVFLNKLNATSRTEAVAIAQRRGILREGYVCLPGDIKAADMGKRSDVTKFSRKLGMVAVESSLVNSDAPQPGTA
jgi:hypothetical protein